MKIEEDYAQRKVDEAKKQIVLNHDKKGVPPEDIARLVEVDMDFVNDALTN